MYTTCIEREFVVTKQERGDVMDLCESVWFSTSVRTAKRERERGREGREDGDNGEKGIEEGRRWVEERSSAEMDSATRLPDNPKPSRTTMATLFGARIQLPKGSSISKS
ncbi:hypothetical protein LOK49_LG02G02529 [Camellia lanceoleosa]|uniref:Uncharacterized protein n=1 Tax=Camellia lanceoleosa TaxID=1840588 RepID=A0ACC0IVT1_9ERIC|nr:hypothetical protein LOK49_LG02G02529 [Camellia lanceoleosa]